MSQDLKEEEQEGNICDHDGESTDEIDGNVDKPKNMKPGAVQLRNWLNKTFRIEMTDGRVLIGIFLCTDRDSNIILGSCSEFLPSVEEGVTEEPRMLGLVMVPGRHIISIYLDTNESYMPDLDEPLPLNVNVGLDEIM